MFKFPQGQHTGLLITLMLMQFTSILDFMIMMPLSAQLMDAFNINTTHFGWLVSAYSVAAGVSALLGSSLLDKFDRKHALLVCYLGLIVATLGCGLAHHLGVLFAARIIAGLFGGLIGAIIMAIVGDLIPPKHRGKAMGLVMLGFSLSAVVGVPLGLFIASHFSWQAPFLILTFACSVILFVAIKQVPNVRSHLSQTPSPFWQSYYALLKVPNHWWGFVMSSLMMFASFMVIPFIAPALVANTGLSQPHLALVYFVGGAATLFSRPIIGKLTDKYRHAHVLLGVTLCSFIPVILVTHTFKVPLVLDLIIAGLFFVLVSGRFIPTTALTTASCTPQFRGRVMAFNSALQNLGSGLAASVAGAIMYTSSEGTLMHYDWVGYISCAVALVGVAAGWRVKAVS